jgi:hypothetical protein
VNVLCNYVRNGCGVGARVRWGKWSRMRQVVQTTCFSSLSRVTSNWTRCNIRIICDRQARFGIRTLGGNLVKSHTLLNMYFPYLTSPYFCPYQKVYSTLITRISFFETSFKAPYKVNLACIWNTWMLFDMPTAWTTPVTGASTFVVTPGIGCRLRDVNEVCSWVR